MGRIIIYFLYFIAVSTHQIADQTVSIISYSSLGDIKQLGRIHVIHFEPGGKGKLPHKQRGEGK